MPSKTNRPATTPLDKLAKFYEHLIYSAPALLYFSYRPRLLLGQTASMNLELSLPLIWLVLFVATSLILAWREKLLNPRKIKPQKYLLLAFPLYASLSVLWSLNHPRAILTVGLLWLLYFAVASILLLAPKIVKNPKFKTNFLRWFFASSLVVCAFCWLQCFLDLAGLPQPATLLCNGCVSEMFGFPHPNGFAIEPQFMGNLLLAPTVLSMWLLLSSRKQCSEGLAEAAAVRRRRSVASNEGASPVKTGASDLSPKNIAAVAFVNCATLFLTFSRGAIYAFIVATIFLTFFQIFRTKTPKILLIWPFIIISFLFTLNAQGTMSTLGPTSDTYGTGVIKVINHLSLGTIDLRQATTPQDLAEPTTDTPTDPAPTPTPDAIFDGYVAESTETRLNLTSDALTIWRDNPKNLIFGVGLGAAGEALYQANRSPSPKQIIQNEYASLLLETGLLGVALAFTTIIFIIAKLLKTKNAPLLAPILTLLLAYAITLCFFSGLPNALQIYLLPPLLYLALRKNKNTA